MIVMMVTVMMITMMLMRNIISMSHLELGQMSLLSGFVKLEKHFLEDIGYILYPSLLLEVVANTTTIRIEEEGE